MSTVGEAIRNAAVELAPASDTARLDAELLMAHALKTARSEMLINRMDALAPAGFGALIQRRMQHEPVAYIVGKTEFFGRPFLVNNAVLIPRPDSETVIEAALDWKSEQDRFRTHGPKILDLGTGSGALLFTLLAEWPRAIGTGVDVSREALRVARANALNLDIGSLSREMARYQTKCLDWREPGWNDDLLRFDLIVCNPPYIEDDACLDRDVREYEPGTALFAGRDGLDDYRTLIPQLRAMMSREAIAIFEIGATQAHAVTELAEKEGFAVELRHDLANRPRALILS